MHNEIAIVEWPCLLYTEHYNLGKYVGNNETYILL